jgi:DNA-binding transcriptional ArsR family regulator
MMKPMKAIKDPEAFQLLADETRRKMVFLLRVKEMTVSQIAAELNKTPQAIYHHIKKLLKGELVEVAREERIDHLIESYYRATAESFFCSVGNTSRSKEFAKDQVRTVLDALKKLGFNLEFDEHKITQLIDVISKIDDCCGSGKFEDAVSELDGVDLLTKQTVREYAETLSISNDEFAKQQEIKKKFRDLLLSMLKK